MQKIWQHVSLNNLNTVAAEVAQYLANAPLIWCFYGQMGAGKTTFIKQLCQAFGVLDNVHSPTYGLVNEYLTEANETIFHFDFYRLESAEEAEGIGTTEYFSSGNLCLLEWPERILPLIPDEHVQLHISGQQENRRTIEVRIHGTTH